jgi:hypothetical protein
MRLNRRSAASAWLHPGLGAMVALSLSALAAMGLSALGALVILTFAGLTARMPLAAAAVGNTPASTVASVVPSAVIPGSQVTFEVSCASIHTASAMFFGRDLGMPEQVPMDAAAAHGDFTITVTLPAHLRLGVYHPSIACSDGTSTTAALTVTTYQAVAAPRTTRPATSTSGFAVGGLALIGVGVVTGGIALRRRMSRSAGTRS